MGRRRRIRTTPEPSAHQQRLSPALLERGDRKLRPQRPQRPDLSERRLPDDDVQGHEALLQGQCFHRRRHTEAPVQRLHRLRRRGRHIQGGRQGRFQPGERPHIPQSGCHTGPLDRSGIRRRAQLPPPAPLRLRQFVGHGVRKRTQRCHHGSRNRVPAGRFARRGDR